MGKWHTILGSPFRVELYPTSLPPKTSSECVLQPLGGEILQDSKEDTLFQP